MFSSRTQWKFNTNKISELLESLKQHDVDVIDLTVSNPTQCGLLFPGKILSSLGQGENSFYEPSAQGLLKAREAVCRYYDEKGLDVHPDQVFLTASSSESYSLLFRLLLDPDEHCLFPQPSYPLFDFLIQLNDVNKDCYALKYDKGWEIDVDQLSSRFGARTRACVLVNPNNPTGTYVGGQALKANIRLCREQQTAIISDEVFFDYSWNKENHQSLVAHQENLTFVLGGVSKALALPQMKLSWVVVGGPKNLVKEASQRLEIICDTYLSVNTPAQNALSAWLMARADIQARILERIKLNRTRLEKQIFSNPACELLQAQGGWYAVLRLSEEIVEEDFVLELLKEDQVSVHPGYFYDFNEGGHVVLSLLTPPACFQEGIGRIFKRVAAVRTRG